MGQNSSNQFPDDIIDFNAKVELKINNVKYEVPSDIHPQTTLNYFIRNYAKLKGTKYMCLEGGCGVCIVSATINNQTISVNSCLVPIFLCHNWNITTIEGIGNKLEGYNSLQSALAENNGSQCGYCSPGMVMNMHSLVQSGKTTTKNIENSFGSNICRCTGYRPILNAFQMFATNDDSKRLTTTNDIEDAHEIIFSKNCKSCEHMLQNFEIIDTDELKIIYLSLNGAKFLKIFNIHQLFTVWNAYPKCSYILNGGNTGNGVYRIDKKDLYIDINSIHDLHKVEKTESSLIFGGNVTLEALKEVFYTYSKEDGFEYLQQLADHIDLIGHVPMRNIGTVAGNLMLKHQHNDFPSDLFLVLETVGAKISILEFETTITTLTFIEFLKIDMNHKLIYKIVLQKLCKEFFYRSYKIMPRAQNAHALINAGFLFKLDSKTKILEKPNIIFGGINPTFLHATKTENYFEGKILLDNNVLQKALDILHHELEPNYVLPDPKPEFRKLLAEGLLYKFILSIKPDEIDIKLRSGGSLLQRSISSGKEYYDIDRNLWPINKPIQKVEAIYQTSGEATYVNDIHIQDREVFAVLLLAEEIGKIKEINVDEAMKMDGVVAIYTAKDIPNKNIFTDSSKTLFGVTADEELFSETEVSYAGQAYGVLVANTQYQALDAAKKVKLIYGNGPRKRAIVTINDALNCNDKTRIVTTKYPAQKKPGESVKHVIKGNFSSGYQYHYTMEPQSCLCVPIEDGLNVFACSQWPDLLQFSIASCLGIPENSINITIKRIGGAYGSKISRIAMPTCACAVAAYKLNRPVRLIMSIEDTMKALGKRGLTYTDYEVGVDDLGNIQYLNLDLYSNKGITNNDTVDILYTNGFHNCYDFSTWNININIVKTDLPTTTWCRGPGTSEAFAVTEHVMEHISKVVNKDSVQVRLQNLSADKKDPVLSMTNEILKTSDFEKRRKSVESYNENNRWKKKGIALTIMNFDVMILGPFYALVSIFARDGTVSITHGGIEIGQGLNTKVVQVAANTLGIDTKLISIKATSNLTAPNNQGSFASFASDCCMSATISACKILVERLKPIREKLGNPTWKDLVFKAYGEGVDLCSIYAFNTTNSEDLPIPYNVIGAGVAEVEVDMLTGQHIVERVDIIEDCGISMNPIIDMGQIQGAFIMGIGLWTSEEIIYDPKSGAITNYRTWNYKPPGAKDIPVDLRVHFLRNSNNPDGVLSSKSTGEPAICLSIVVRIAIENAINSARKDAGNSNICHEQNGPLTVENTLLASLTKKEDMIL